MREKVEPEAKSTGELISSSSKDDNVLASYKDRADYSVLNPSELKGFYFEMFIQRETKSRGIKYRGNPVDPITWKRQNNKHDSIDIIVRPYIWNSEYYELKWLHPCTKLYVSWLQRDWLPRASKVPKDKKLIFLTSNSAALDEECKNRIEELGAELWQTSRFLRHLDFINAMHLILCAYLQILYHLLYQPGKNSTLCDCINIYNVLLRLLSSSPIFGLKDGTGPPGNDACPLERPAASDKERFTVTRLM